MTDEQHILDYLESCAIQAAAKRYLKGKNGVVIIRVEKLDEETQLMRDPHLNAQAARLAWELFSKPVGITIDCGDELKAKVLARLVKQHLERVQEFMI